MRLAIPTFLLLSLASLTLATPAFADNIRLSSDPDCVSWGVDRIDCVARATDSALWHTSWTSGTWNGWESFGGNLTSGPSVTSSAPGQLDMFARGPDNALWHIVWDGSLHSWESLGGILTSDPDCTSAVLGIIDCFVKGANNALWHISFNAGTWSAWESAGGLLASGPGASSVLTWNGEKLLRVFVKAMDNAMWDIIFTPSTQWGQWEKLGGILTSDPDAVHSFNPQEVNDPQSSSNRFDIVVRGPDNGIWWKWWRANVGWSSGCQGCGGFEKLGGLSNSGPTVVSRGWNSLDVFAVGMDNHLYHRGWDGAAWSPWGAVPMSLAAAVVTTSITLAATSSESSTTLSSSTAISNSSVWCPLPQTSERST
jgi:hypothetical protein